MALDVMATVVSIDTISGSASVVFVFTLLGLRLC